MEPSKQVKLGHWGLICFALLLSTRLSYAQFTQDQEAKMNEIARQAKEIVKNLPRHEKKIQGYIRKRINKMIEENAKGDPNIKEKYSSDDLLVDQSGRMHVNVSLFLSASASDTLAVTRKIVEVGGVIQKVTIPNFRFPINIYCWIPYEAIKEIAKLESVGGISSVGRPHTRTGSVKTIGDTQLLADVARSQFQCNGTGVKVGVISDGIAHRSYSQSTQDLDAIEFTYPGKPDGDESTAMLEIVHDIAPGASLNPDSPEALRVFAEDISNLTYDDTIYFYPKQTNVTTEFVIERHMQSNALNSTTYNNGRRMVRDSSRKYHLVYESQAFLWFIPQMRTSWRRKAKSIPDEGNEKFKYQNAN